ncbi:phosphatidylinositol N-acetylglucosaminyltransferase subunit Gpi1p [Trichomonascus vanleenenianus]|uniref:phosphatidylinositol N-acetylglucosaminyltransferase n=1 Tax=Trichomonascus vanleenenianus TaxID=2268995 RepID=UPI003ECAC7E3
MPVLRIFWPLDALGIERQRGYEPAIVVGWRNSPTDVVVVTTLPYLDPAKVDHLLRSDVLLQGSQCPVSSIYSLCGAKRMEVLGTMNCDYTMPLGYQNLPIDAIFGEALRYPTHRCPDQFEAVQVVMFESPQSYHMQYFSTRPISLELSEKSALTVISEEYEADLVDAREHAQLLIQRIKRHTRGDNSDGGMLEKTISQINCGYELGRLLRENAVIIFPKMASKRRRLSMSETIKESAKSVQTGVENVAYKAFYYFLPLLSRMLVFAIMVCRIIAEAILRVIEYKPLAHWYALKDVSATAQQIDLRLQQFCFWPIQYSRIRRRTKDMSANTAANVEYIRYYNSIWLVANDVILGFSIGRIILDNRQAIVYGLNYLVDEILTNAFKSNMLWLMDWPGGLKLNNEVAAFFGELFLWVIQFWHMSLSLFRPYFHIIVAIVGYSGFFGATYCISLISDIVSLLTLHVYSFYIASARIYHWQLLVLYSLLQLFRGKKRNVLRNRIDSCNYELDQLLMGTIFFTVLIFLLPTVLVFYLTFAGARLAIVVFCAVLETSLMFLNHFPLFVMLLRIKDPKRIPGGIVMRYEQSNLKERSSLWSLIMPSHDLPQAVNNPQSYQSFAYLQPVPLSFTNMFHQYNIVIERIRLHYASFGVIKRLLTGQFVPIKRSKLYGLLYSMLPEERFPINTLYRDMKNMI